MVRISRVQPLLHFPSKARCRTKANIIYFLITGPSTWVSKFPMAAGSRQSPVNIETDRVESDHEALSSKPLRWKYSATASRKLVNPGYCWRMDTDGEGTCKFIFIFHETIRESYLSHRAIGYCLSEIAYVDTDRYRA